MRLKKIQNRIKKQNISKLILVVEDDKCNMKLAVDLLKLAGFGILKASDGETALEMLKTERPDLIVLDIRLPGINGVEVFKQIRVNPILNFTKIVACTASVMKHEKEEILQAGFDAFITKPINTINFIKVIEMLSYD
jgi:two-component system cell cycle response regulator DivK